MNMRVELHTALVEIEATIEAQRRGYMPQVGAPTIYGALDTNGRPMIADLLCAKANLLVAIALTGEGPS